MTNDKLAATGYKHGGLFIESNLQLACWPCNGRKGARWDA